MKKKRKIHFFKIIYIYNVSILRSRYESSVKDDYANSERRHSSFSERKWGMFFILKIPMQLVLGTEFLLCL